MSQTMIALVFILGFFAGGICGWLGNQKFSQNRRLQDELTRTRRDLAGARRSLDDFFKTSSSLFEQLNKSYRNFARFMNDSANKLSTEGHEGFDLSLPEKLPAKTRAGKALKGQNQAALPESGKGAAAPLPQSADAAVPALQDAAAAKNAAAKDETPAAAEGSASASRSAAAGTAPDQAPAAAEKSGGTTAAAPEAASEPAKGGVEILPAKENVMETERPAADSGTSPREEKI